MVNDLDDLDGAEGGPQPAEGREATCCGSWGTWAQPAITISGRLRIDEAAFGPNHPKVAIRVSHLGRVLQELGNLDGARAHYQRALRIFEAVYGPDHPRTRTVADDLSSLP